MKTSESLFKIAKVVAVLSLLMAVTTTPVTAGYYFRYDEDVQGKVIDADTGQPLEGAVVMVMWVTQHTRITIEPDERYYDYFETLTDGNGEFAIPGKGRNFFRNMPPPKIRIYKAGYPIRDIRFVPSGYYPPGIEVTLKDGKRIVSYKKLSMEKRKEYVPRYKRIPYSEMIYAAVPPAKYRLYSEELAREYQSVGLRQRQPGAPVLVIRKGGYYPAANQPVTPQKK